MGGQVGGTVSGSGGGRATITATPKTVRQPLPTARNQQQQNINNRIGEILSATGTEPAPMNRDLSNIVDSSETFESVLPQNIDATEGNTPQVQFRFSTQGKNEA